MDELSEARDEFHAMLQRSTSEADWQAFFATRPYVLSMSLPVRLESSDIVPLGRPGRTEPDFIFYPHGMSPAPYYGVIELKKPTTSLLVRPRKNVAILSRDAETAIAQADAYSRKIRDHAPVPLPEKPLFLGNERHNFVILGLRRELAEKLGTDLYFQTVLGRLPPGLQLIPYDSLLALFEAHIPPAFHVLIPDEVPTVGNPLSSLARVTIIGEINEAWEAVYGAAVAYGTARRESFARSAHGYRPEWMIKTWLPTEFGNVDRLREDITDNRLSQYDDDVLIRLAAALRRGVSRAASLREET